MKVQKYGYTDLKEVANRFTKLSFVVLLTFLSCKDVMAQASAGAVAPSKQVNYVLPDGKVLPQEKQDSLEQAWGKGRIMFRHTAEEDAKGIIHLVRLTDEMKQQLEAQNEQRRQEFDAMRNKPAPDFTLTDLHGNSHSLRALRGKIVVLNFWFTSCAPCIREMPELNKLAKAYNSNEVVFWALTFNNGDQVRTFQKKRTFDYIILPNSYEVDQKFHISSWPTSMVIDQEGTIKFIIQSSPKIREELGNAIDALL